MDSYWLAAPGNGAIFFCRGPKQSWQNIFCDLFKLNNFQPGLGPWHVVFGVTAGLLLVEFVVYAIFASGEEQPWNKEKDSASNHENIELNKDNERKA